MSDDKTVTISLPNPSDLAAWVQGRKTYIVLAAGMAVIALNHFGLLPNELKANLNLDPANWLNDEYKLLLGATGRSALAKIDLASLAKMLATMTPAPAAAPAAAPKPPASVVTSPIILALIVGLALFAPPAFAETVRKPAVRTAHVGAAIARAERDNGGRTIVMQIGRAPFDAIGDFINKISAAKQEVIAGVIDDINAADADAGAQDPDNPGQVKDPISHACYPAQVRYLKSLPNYAPLQGKYTAVQLFQRKRNFVARLRAGIPVYLKLGCAPLLGDEATIFVQTLALVGIGISANGILPGVASIALPKL